MPRHHAEGKQFRLPQAPGLEVDEELAGHLELLTQRFMQEGFSEPDARARALERFGNMQTLTRECHVLRTEIEEEVRRTEWRNDLASDVRFSFRSMRLHPIVSAITVLTLALGIGAGVGVLNIVYTVLGRPLPYTNASRVVTFWNSYPAGQLLHAAVAVPEYFDLKAQLKTVEQVAAIRQEKVPLVTAEGDATELVSYRTTPNAFTLLGVAAATGRAFRTDDGAPGSPPVVLLSDAFWRRQFGSDRTIIGQSLDIAGVRRSVIGVMPPRVAFPDLPLGHLAEPADIWIPDSFEALRNDERGNQFIGVMALRALNASTNDVRRELDQLENRWRREFPTQYAPPNVKAWRLADTSLMDEFFGKVRAQMMLLAIAALSLVLIACTNAANLLLARGAGRVGEFAVRRALGAGRQRLVRQLLTESVAMAVVSSVAAAYLAHLVVRLAVNANASDIPRLASARMSAGWLLMALVLAMLAGVLIGLVPALRLSRLDALPGTARQPHRRFRLQQALGIVQVALTLTVLVSTGLFMRSFVALQRVQSGFVAQGVATGSVTLPRVRYDSAYKTIAFATSVLNNLAAQPGISGVALIYPLPLSGNGWSGSFALDDQANQPGEPPHAEYAVASPAYFRTMGIPLRSGREFTMDDRRGGEAVAIVDEHLARRYWPRENAVGKRLRVGGPTGNPATVVGVVGHVRNGGARNDGEPQLYLPILQRPQRVFAVVTRSATPLRSLTTIAATVHEVDSRQPVSRSLTMQALERDAVARDRFNLVILSIFGAAALLLVTMGLYGLVALTATERLNELGVRLALGARLWSVRWLVIRDGAYMLVVGVAIGVGISLGVSQVLGSMLFGVTPIDPLTYVSIVMLMTVVTLGAATRVSLRATSSTALRALRQS